MRKLVALSAAVVAALALSACGDNAEKKSETQATTNMEQGTTNTGTTDNGTANPNNQKTDTNKNQ